MAIRDKFRTFEGEWKDFLPVKDIAIPRLRAFIGLPERYLERTKLVDEGGMSMVESWYVAMIIRLRILEEIQNEIAQHSARVDASISTMMSNVGLRLILKISKRRTSMRQSLGRDWMSWGRLPSRRNIWAPLPPSVPLSDM